MISEVKTDLSAGVLTVTLSRPAKKNALTNAMYAALADAIQRADTDQDVRVLLIQADGEIFTSGNDISEFAAQSAGADAEERHVMRFLRGLASTSVPIIAAVQGKAVGVGTTMLLHCDYVLLGDDAELMTPFVNLALIPEAASSYLLPQRIGYARAFEMFSLGEPVSAESAFAWGIANKVVPAADLHVEAKQMAVKIAAKPLGSLTAMKRLMRDSERTLAQIDLETGVFEKRLQSAEAREAFAAFAQKRQPDFSRIR